ncbi:MAG: preprotein translocase subunit SecG [Patescibacteria group bacterium]
MNTALTIIQILLSVLLITLIFLQSNGEGEYKTNILSTVSYEKRGWEKFLFTLTFLVLSLFILSSIVQIILI